MQGDGERELFENPVIEESEDDNEEEESHEDDEEESSEDDVEDSDFKEVVKESVAIQEPQTKVPKKESESEDWSDSNQESESRELSGFFCNEK